ncbi:MAG: hypothetical protein ACON4T_05630 [Synechococcus sp.]
MVQTPTALLRDGEMRTKMQRSKDLNSGVADEQEFLDLTIFNDPLALEIPWDPMSRGGSSICTHRAKQNTGVDGTTLQLQMTTEAKRSRTWFITTAPILGIPLILLFVLLAIFANVLVALFVIIPFAAIFRSFPASLYQDFRQEQRKECTLNKFTGELIRRAKTHAITDVYAIQLLRKRIKRRTQNYTYDDCYELNLVRRDGTRLNVTNHGSLSKIRADADLVADYLHIPIWDVID